MCTSGPRSTFARWRRSALSLTLFGSLLLGGVQAIPAKERKGQILDISARGKVAARLNGRLRGDEFGSGLGADVVPGTRRGGCVIGAPGAHESIGQINVYDCFDQGRKVAGELLFVIRGDSLSGGTVSRFGESLKNLGHVGGDHAVHWAIGAPGRGEPEGPPSAFVILHGEGETLVERLRLESDPEARLGWRIVALEIRPGTSFFASSVVSAPGQARGRKASAGAVHRVNTNTGHVMWTKRGARKRQFFGYALAKLPDITGDGIPDLMIGSPGRPEGRARGRVQVLSGSDGREIERIDAPRGANLFGFAVTSMDLDGDGIFDYVVGAPGVDGAAGVDSGAVFAYSGVDLERLWTWEGTEPGQWLGTSLASAGDRDGDGVREVAAASLFAGNERARRGGLEIFLSSDRRVLFRRLGKKADDRLGWPILNCGENCRVGVPRSAEFYAPW